MGRGGPDKMFPGREVLEEFDGLEANSRRRRKHVLHCVSAERGKQVMLKDWTSAHDDQHTPLAWVAIMAYELAGAADVALNGPIIDHFERACIKVAATAVAAVEAIHRQRGTEGAPMYRPFAKEGEDGT